jgi:hypothetical protein
MQSFTLATGRLEETPAATRDPKFLHGKAVVIAN